MNMLRRLYFALAVVLIAANSAQTQDDLRKAQELYDRAMQKKEPAAKIQLLQQAAQLLAKKNPASAQAANIHYSLGREFYRQAKWPLAVFHLEKAFELAANSVAKDHLRLLAQAHNGLALQHLGHGKLESARQSALAAIRCDSSSMAAHTTLGLALFQQGKYDAAIAAYQKALQANPTAQLYNNLGAAQEAKGELVAAVEAYRQALELEAGLASAQKNLQRAREKLPHAAAAALSEKPAIIDTLQNMAIRRDSLIIAAPKPPERLSKSKRTKSGKVEPAKAPQKNASALVLPSPAKTTPAKKKIEDKTANPESRHVSPASTLIQKSGPGESLIDTTAGPRSIPFAEKSPLFSMPSSVAINPSLSKPLPAGSATVQAIPSPVRHSRSSIKFLAFISAIALMILAFVRRRRLGQVWLQLKPALATSTAEVTRQVRLLPARIWRNNGVVRERELAPKPVVVAKEEKNAVASLAAGINENLEPRQPSLQTQAFFAEMIAAEPEIEDFDDEAVAEFDEAPPANGHVEAPPTSAVLKKVTDDEISLLAPAPAVVSFAAMECNNSGIALPSPSALISNGANVLNAALEADSTGAKRNGAAPITAPSEKAVEPTTGNTFKRSEDADFSGQTAASSPGERSHKLATSNPQQTFGRYLIEGEIGKGAMGNIYLAWDPKLDRRVVIKTVCFTLATSEVDTSTLKDRVYREARAIAKLGHPNIVVVYDVEDEKDMSYIVMEHIEGRDLRQALQSEHRFDYPRAVKIMAQVCSALDYAHRAGIVHRDIKPSNIMLLPGDKAKVTDFGIAKIADNFSLTLPGHVLGTPSYMAPEQFEGQEIDGRADLFSLGVVLYELITGCRPFTGNSMASLAYKIVHKMHLPPSLQNVELPLELDEIIGKALAKNPEERYATAMELREALLGVQVENSVDFQSAKM